MCSGSYECNHTPPEAYRPSQEVKTTMRAALAALNEVPGSVRPIGKRFLGMQRFQMMGWYHDEESNQLVELCATFIDRGRISNFLFNPHRSRQSIRTISVAHISLDDSEGAMPYRLFLWHIPTDKLDTCIYDDYEADRLAVPSLGSSVVMQERFEEAVMLGEDVVTLDQEQDLIRSLAIGSQVGWQTQYMDTA